MPDAVAYRRERTDVAGPVDSDVVLRIVAPRMPEVEFCLRRGVAETPRLAGRVEVRADISKTGTVSRAYVVSTTIADARVGRCIAAALSRWRYPASDEGQSSLTLSLVLDPSAG